MKRISYKVVYTGSFVPSTSTLLLISFSLSFVALLCYFSFFGFHDRPDLNFVTDLVPETTYVEKAGSRASIQLKKTYQSMTRHERFGKFEPDGVRGNNI